MADFKVARKHLLQAIERASEEKKRVTMPFKKYKLIATPYLRNKPRGIIGVAVFWEAL